MTEKMATSQFGVELLLLYHSEQFTVDETRLEVQSSGIYSNSSEKFLKCVIPGLHTGHVTYHDLRTVIQPLFSVGNIRGIAQVRGSADGTMVVDVTYPDDDEDADEDTGYAGVDGRYYSCEEVEEDKFTAIIASGDDEMEKELKKRSLIKAIEKGGDILIAEGERRTVLYLRVLQTGVELLLFYHPEHFTVDSTRPEVQCRGTFSNSTLRRLDCIVPGLHTGLVAYHDLRTALQTLFPVGTIRGIQQMRGSADGTMVVDVAHPDVDRFASGDPGYASVDGRHYSIEEVKERKSIAFIAPEDDEIENVLKKRKGLDAIDKGGDIYIAEGERRTVFYLYVLQTGVELRVRFPPEQFTVDDTRYEAQSRGKYSDSNDHFLNCVIPGLHAGLVAFHDLRTALQPLFSVGNIRGIAQARGSADGTTVVDVAHPDDDEDAKGSRGYASVVGRYYSREEVEEEKFTAIIASGDDEMEKELKKRTGLDAIGDRGGIIIPQAERRAVLFIRDLKTVIE